MILRVTILTGTEVCPNDVYSQPGNFLSVPERLVEQVGDRSKVGFTPSMP